MRVLTRHLLVVLAGFFTAILCPHDARAEDSRVAIVALDGRTDTRAAVRRLGDILGSHGRGVQYGDRLDAAIREKIVDPPAPEAGRVFADFNPRIAAGIKSFFYRGPGRAIEQLEPVVDTALSEIRLLVRRPDLVDQVYEAGLVMIRALRSTDRSAEADDLAATLMTYFPTRLPSLDTMPPPIIAAMEDAAKELATEQTRVAFDPGPDAADCNVFLNGSPVGEGVIEVAADFEYFVSLDCGIRKSPMWRLKVPGGGAVTVPLSIHDPSRFEMGDDSYEQRRRAERVLESIQFWGGFDEVVGIRGARAAGGPTLFAHIRGTSMTWTETSARSAVDGFARNAFAIDGSAQPDAEATAAASSASGSFDWLAWSSIGVGAVAGVGGVLSFRAAIVNNRRLACYDNREDPASGCEGVPSDGLVVTADRADEENKVIRRQQVVAYALWGVSAATIGFGIVRLLTPKNDAVSFFVTPTGAALAVEFR